MPGRSHRPAVRTVFKGFRGFPGWLLTGVCFPTNTAVPTDWDGVYQRFGGVKDTLSTENKDRLALRMGPDTKRKIEQWYKAAGCRSKNQFVERAVNFYVDHLAVQDDSGTLPRAVLSSLDGRLGMFEDRMASLIYKHTVELDMMMGILADSYELSEEDMRRRRAESVRNVKNTNGRMPFEQKVRAANEAEDKWPD